MPAVSRLREVAEVVAVAVAKQAQLDGVAAASVTRATEAHAGQARGDREIAEAVRATMWQPVYKPYKRVMSKYGLQAKLE